MKIRNQTTLYFIRHGQTPANKEGLKQGNHIDDYLNTEGILEVEKLSEKAKLLDLDILFSSYLHRADETAHIIYNSLGAQLPLLHDYRLRERDLGSLTGKTEKGLEKLQPGWKEKDQMQMYDYTPFGGESVQLVRTRVFGALLDMAQNYHHQNIGVVTHDGVIRLILFHFPKVVRLYHNQESSSNDIDNTDIYEWVVTDTDLANIKSLLQ
jgi:broad specificity phosphatase PhoE